MAKIIDALDYLTQPADHPRPAVCVVFGDEEFLCRRVLARLRLDVLGADDDGFSLTSFTGRTAEWPEVLGELETLCMFGPQRRMVVVEAADDFIKTFRTELEDYVVEPSSSGVLVLAVKSWPANTRLYKLLVERGLSIQCEPPKPSRLGGWLQAWAQHSHSLKLEAAAAQMLSELVGPELGLLDQELAKLAVCVVDGRAVSEEMVAAMVGTWRTKTAWQMLEAALAGNTSDALMQLDRLLLAGEHPLAVLAQISSSLRRFAAATRIVLQEEAAGRRPQLRQALQAAGVKPFVLQRAAGELKRLGRYRGARLHRWLLQADLDLKGSSALPPRLIVERLIVRISAAR